MNEGNQLTLIPFYPIVLLTRKTTRTLSTSLEDSAPGSTQTILIMSENSKVQNVPSRPLVGDYEG